MCDFHRQRRSYWKSDGKIGCISVKELSNLNSQQVLLKSTHWFEQKTIKEIPSLLLSLVLFQHLHNNSKKCLNFVLFLSKQFVYI